MNMTQATEVSHNALLKCFTHTHKTIPHIKVKTETKNWNTNTHVHTHTHTFVHIPVSIAKCIKCMFTAVHGW